MTPQPERFAHYIIARQADSLARSPEEVVFLAFDTRIRRFVELHILKESVSRDALWKQSTLERALQAADIRGPGVLRIVGAGEEEGFVYYASSLNAGESVPEYVSRVGALPVHVALGLVMQLLDDLICLQSYPRLSARVSLSRLLVTTLEFAYLQLRIVDLGLLEREAPSDDPSHRQMCDLSELLFLLLTGRNYAGEDPRHVFAFSSLPPGLQSILASGLARRSDAVASLEQYLEEVKAALAQRVPDIGARSTRRYLAVPPELLPRTQLEELLLGGIAVEEGLRERYVLDRAEGARGDPFTIPVTDMESGQAVTLHLLPAGNVLPKEEFDAAPGQKWNYNPRKHSQILRPLGVWEGPDWTLRTAERETGFPLSKLLAERVHLAPREVYILLRQVHAAMEQAVDCGVPRIDVHPSNVLIQVGGVGPLAERSFDEVAQSRVDLWPAVQARLRPRITMRGLWEQPLVEREPKASEDVDANLRDRDFRRRSLVALAVHLLTGGRTMGRMIEFPAAVSDELAAYLRECLALGDKPGATPSPADFLDGFKNRMGAAPSREAEGVDAAFLLGLAGSGSQLPEPEKAVEPQHAPAVVRPPQRRESGESIVAALRRVLGTHPVATACGALIIAGTIVLSLLWRAPVEKGSEAPAASVSSQANQTDPQEEAPATAAVGKAETTPKIDIIESSVKAERKEPAKPESSAASQPAVQKDAKSPNSPSATAKADTGKDASSKTSKADDPEEPQFQVMRAIVPSTAEKEALRNKQPVPEPKGKLAGARE